MTNPVGTKEQRDDLRELHDKDLNQALDGLDIAEDGMLAEAVLETALDLVDKGVEFDFGYWNAALRAQREALRRWQAWREWANPC